MVQVKDRKQGTRANEENVRTLMEERAGRSMDKYGQAKETGNTWKMVGTFATLGT